MRKSYAILRALEDATEPQTPDELAAAIDSPDDGKIVGQLLCALRTKGHAHDVDKRGRSNTWIITDAGRQFITDVLAEQHDASASAPAAARRVAAADRKRRDPEGPGPVVWSRRHSGVTNGHAPAAVESLPAVPAPAPDHSVAVREDGALIVLEGGRIACAISPELALRIAHLVRRLRAAEGT
jgi:hypothetical protein